MRRTYDPTEVADRQLATGDGVSLTIYEYKQQEKRMNGFNKAEQARRAAEFSAAQAAKGLKPPVLPMPPVPKKAAPVPKDFQGTELQVGQKVARAMTFGSSPYLSICEVTRVEGMNVYLDNSPRALIYTNRVIVLK
jgi:hypothetical protein